MNDFHEDSKVPQKWRLGNLASGNGVLITPEGEFILTYSTGVQAIERSNDLSMDEKAKFLSVISSKLNKIKIQPPPPKTNVTIVKTEPCDTSIVKSEPRDKVTKVALPIEKNLIFPGGNIQVTRIKIEKNAETLPPNPSPSPVPSDTSVNKKTDSAHWEEDETAPKGWKSCDKLGKKFRDPSGRYYPSRMDALRNMIKDKSVSKEDIEKMRRGLIVDGWEVRENLPTGWMLRQKLVPRRPGETPEKMVLNFLSPTFDFLNKNDVLAYMHKNGYPETEIKKFHEVSRELNRSDPAYLKHI